MAEAFLEVVLHNLNSIIQMELGLLWGVEKEMQKLSSTLSTVQAVLEDAEEKQVRDKAIQNWLMKLKDAAYDADDILDELATEASRLQLQNVAATNNNVCSSFITCFGSNNILFRHQIANRLKDAVRRLDEIAEERIKFHLREMTFAQRHVEVFERRQTGSIITQPVVYGREKDEEKIVQYLLSSALAFDDVSIYPIVGIGGLGKTTVAQMVFNDERIRNHFELRIWVCVSDDFDVKRVIKATIESASGTACDALDLDPLQKRLQGILNGKRYLIVLDDLWNDDPEKWDRLKYVLACGSKGASIIVTTRLVKVASIVGTIPAHHLTGLSQDDSWSLFKERAFGQETALECLNLVAIGKEMVNKCGGVPLALKALGSLMRFKREEIQWVHVKECELWNLPQDENSILPSLRLSYFNLPLKIRRCFAYCSVFPKNYEIKVENLIQLWMANGLISSDGALEMEDVGDEICNELYLRSLFQDVEKEESGNILSVKMHDLVHDLAEFVTGEECHILEPGGSRSANLCNKIRHLTVPYSKQSFTIHPDMLKIESLRTLRLVKSYPFHMDEGISRLSCDFSKLHSLRALVASGYGLAELSSGISSVKHLRYIDLSRTKIRALPESICRLWNLQILKLDGCSALQRLPEHLSLLKNLRHLCIDGCRSLSYFPPKIGELTCLRTLSRFIVGRKKGCHLSELERLDLKGKLHIEHLERVRNPMEAKEANLSRKKKIHCLSLHWDHNSRPESSEHADQKVLESLEPFQNLDHLIIEGYAGMTFPRWMSETVLNNVASFSLKDCRNCVDLTPLSKLPSLKNLRLERMNNVQYLENENQNHCGRTIFPSLELLLISDLPMLVRLTLEERRELFPHLYWLHIVNCPKLSLPCNLPVKDLYIKGCTETTFNSISNLNGLKSLHIFDSNMTSFPEGVLQNLIALEVLCLENITKLKVFPGDLFGANSLKTLRVEGCHELESFPEQGLQDLSSLQSLEIANCTKFRSLSEEIRYLTSLQSLSIRVCPQLAALPNDIGYLLSLESLRISNCPHLTSLPSSIKNLTNLNYLTISKCSELVQRCEKRVGEDWHKISHIPYVYLDGRCIYA